MESEVSFHTVTPEGADLWQVEKGRACALLLLTDEAVFFSTGKPEAMGTLAGSLERAGLADPALVKTFTRVPLKNVKSVSGNERKNKFTIFYASIATMIMKKGGQARADFQALEVAALKHIFDAFERRLGPGTKRTRTEVSPAQALLPGLLFTLGIAGLTVLAALNFEWIRNHESTGRRSALINGVITLLQWLGPVGTSVAGAIFALVFLYASCEEYRNPPIKLSIKPGKAGPRHV